LANKESREIMIQSTSLRGQRIAKQIKPNQIIEQIRRVELSALGLRMHTKITPIPCTIAAQPNINDVQYITAAATSIC
jgi:hypothetical protein